MSKTFRHVERSYGYGEMNVKKFRKNSKNYSELISPRVFYNKISSRKLRDRQLAKKRRTTYK